MGRSFGGGPAGRSLAARRREPERRWEQEGGAAVRQREREGARRWEPEGILQAAVAPAKMKDGGGSLDDRMEDGGGYKSCWNRVFGLFSFFFYRWKIR